MNEEVRWQHIFIYRYNGVDRQNSANAGTKREQRSKRAMLSRSEEQKQEGDQGVRIYKQEAAEKEHDEMDKAKKGTRRHGDKRRTGVREYRGVL